MSTSASKIQWTDKTLNPTRGCSIISDGCRFCYAQRQAYRFSGPGQPYEGLVRMTSAGPKWTGKIRLVPEALEEPLRWRKPARIFIDSMSDLFHEDVPFGFVDQMMAVIALTPRHSYQLLTKRPDRMLDYFSDKLFAKADTAASRLSAASYRTFLSEEADCQTANSINGVLGKGHNVGWPMRNLWIGTSVENQATADDRIPLLLQTPAAVRFLSCEPLLECLDLAAALSDQVPTKEQVDGPHGLHYLRHGAPGVDWVIAGGESGPGARPCGLEWIRDIARQCEAAHVPCFVKQLGSRPLVKEADPPSYPPRRSEHSSRAQYLTLRDKKGGDPSEWPGAFPREFPDA
jgi:protein gp37